MGVLTSVFGMGTGMAPPLWSPAKSLGTGDSREPQRRDGEGLKQSKAARLISTARLNASLRLHLRPIEVVVYNLT